MRGISIRCRAGEKLNEHRKASKVKTEVTEATFDTSDSYGSKVSDNTDKGGVKA